MSPYNRPAAFVCFNPPKQRPGERFSFRPPVVSIQSHSNRCRGHPHAHVALLFRRPAREFHVYLDTRRALVPSNATVVREREVLAAAVGGDQRAALSRARGRVERDFDVCGRGIVGVVGARRRHLRGVLSLSKEALRDGSMKRSRSISLFSFARIFCERFFSNSTPHKSLSVYI